ncbi:MAG TPA: tetratricopeptide repeat protein [bacterium]|nr:tetratricopeptide repeat protein [bacterium]HQP98765.1 tetratricopeptide repeat protein [bacterium]
MTQRPPILTNPWIHVPVILILVFLAYIPALSVSWYFDDFSYAVENWKLHTPERMNLVFHNFLHRGVVLLSYAIDWHLSNKFGLQDISTETVNPSLPIYHLSSIVYHLLNVAGVFLLVRKLISLLSGVEKKEGAEAESEPMWPASAVALLYGLHPINTEAVTYLSGRASVLATIGYVFGLWSFLIAAERFGFLDEHPGERSRRDRVIGISAFLCAAVCFVLGIGSKEIIVTMPVMGILILAFLIARQFPLGTVLRRLLPFCAFAGVLVVGFLVYRIQSLGGIVGFEESGIRPWWVNLLSQIGVISLYYLPRQLCLLPLCIEPEVPEIHSILHPNVIFGIIVLGGLVFLAVRSAERAPLVTIGLLWYFVALAPTSSIVPLNDLAAERHTYLPNVGFVLAFAGGLNWAGATLAQLRSQPHASTGKVPIVVVGCLAVLLGAFTVERNLLYTDPIQFWLDTERRSPHKSRVQGHLAREYHNLARACLVDNRLQEAEEALQETLRRFAHIPPEIRPLFADTPVVLGVLLMTESKEYTKAAQLFEQCIQYWPEQNAIWNNLGICYLKTGELGKARELALQWLKRDPDSVSARLLTANCLYAEGNMDQAEISYLEIINTYGEVPSALGILANIARARGDTATAEKYQARALASWPEDVSKPTEVDGIARKIHIAK